MARHRTQRPFRTKRGPYGGTLYLYRVPYQDGPDFDNRGVARIWAYSAEDAEDRFYENNEDADGRDWCVNGAITRVREPAGG